MYQVELFVRLYCLILLNEGSLQTFQKSMINFYQKRGNTEDFSPSVFTKCFSDLIGCDPNNDLCVSLTTLTFSLQYKTKTNKFLIKYHN